MKVVQIAGFLGSGKTTLMIRLGKKLSGRGRRVAIIVNEIGEVGVDGEVISSYGLESIELPEGCICCSLAGSLQDTLITLADNYHPDYILLEPTGLALPSSVDNIIRTSLIPVEKSVTIALVDAYRVDKILIQNSHFIKRQLEGIDLLVLNKIDIVSAERLDETERAIRDIRPDAEIVRISAKTGDGVEKLFGRMGV